MRCVSSSAGRGPGWDLAGQVGDRVGGRRRVRGRCRRSARPDARLGANRVRATSRDVSRPCRLRGESRPRSVTFSSAIAPPSLMLAVWWRTGATIRISTTGSTISSGRFPVSSTRCRCARDAGEGMSRNPGDDTAGARRLLARLDEAGSALRHVKGSYPAGHPISRIAARAARAEETRRILLAARLARAERRRSCSVAGGTGTASTLGNGAAIRFASSIS